MEKTNPKLNLRRETVRELARPNLSQIQGGFLSSNGGGSTSCHCSHSCIC